MTDQPVSRVVSEVDELLGLTDLAAIVFNEISAVRTGNEDEPNAFRMDVSSQVSDEEIGVKCRAVVAGAGGSYVAEAVASFSLSDAVEINEATLLEFVERVGVMAVYPYIRASVSDSAAKIGCKTPVLRLLRPGGVKLHPADESDG